MIFRFCENAKVPAYVEVRLACRQNDDAKAALVNKGRRTYEEVRPFSHSTLKIGKIVQSMGKIHNQMSQSRLVQDLPIWELVRFGVRF